MEVLDSGIFGGIQRTLDQWISNVRMTHPDDAGYADAAGPRTTLGDIAL